MPYKRKHPALVWKRCEKCGVEFVVTSAQLRKIRCGDFKKKTGCIAETGKLAQRKYRKNHPEIAKIDNTVWNYTRQLERAQAKIRLYKKRYGAEVLLSWLTTNNTD
jgi:hypothetical protein